MGLISSPIEFGELLEQLTCTASDVKGRSHDLMQHTIEIKLLDSLSQRTLSSRKLRRGVSNAEFLSNHARPLNID